VLDGDLPEDALPRRAGSVAVSGSRGRRGMSASDTALGADPFLDEVLARN